MVIFGKLAKLLLCYKRYVLSHPRLHLPVTRERDALKDLICHVGEISDIRESAKPAPQLFRTTPPKSFNSHGPHAHAAS